MHTRSADFARGFAALRLALADVLYPASALACAGAPSVSQRGRGTASWLMSEAVDYQAPAPEAGPPDNDSSLACSSE